MAQKPNLIVDINIIKYNHITIIFNNIINTDFTHFSFRNNLDIATVIITINIIGIIIQGTIAPSNTSIQNLIGGSCVPANNENDNIRNAEIINPILLMKFRFIIKTPNI